MAPERDLHVLHVFATFAAGGPQVRTARVLTALPASWSHSVVALDGRTTAAELLPPNARALASPPRAGSLPTVARLRRLYATLQPDLIATYNWGAIDGAVAARLASIPLVHHEETVADDEVGTAALRRDLFRRLTLRSAAALVVPSGELRHKAETRWRLPSARVHRIDNGIDCAARVLRDGRADLRRSLGIPIDAFVVGFLGNLRPEKGLDALLQALALAADPNMRALVVGDGPERAPAECMAAQRGIAHRVHFVGHQTHPHEHLRAMDAFVLPSRREQMPLALLEAMAHGLPIVASDVGEVRAMLPSIQRAWIVAAGDASAIAARCAALRAHPEQRLALGRANRAFVAKHFGADAMVAAYRAIFLAAVRRPAVAAGGRS